jgi:hypothetical protein
MSGGIIFLMIVMGCLLIYGVYEYVKRYSALDIIAFVFIMISCFGLVKLVRYSMVRKIG